MLVACPVRFPSALALACVLLNWPAAASAQGLTCTEMEEFLRHNRKSCRKVSGASDDTAGAVPHC